MSLETYQWDLEENVEDAIVALLRDKLAGTIAMVLPAYTVQAVKYPLIVVEAGASDNHSDEGEFNGRRRMDVTVAITTEAVNKHEGVLPEDARARHRQIKSAVLGWIASVNELHTELNAMNPTGVKFSQAHMTGQDRSVGANKIITEQTLDVIAQPLEG